jgi:hypothetical protein
MGARALNRALLARQHLLARHSGTALDMVEHLVGLQAQEPQEPYVELWSRLRNFAPDDLCGLLERRDAVRVLLMRRTLHLVSVRDVLALRGLHDPMLVTRMRRTLGRRLPGVDELELATAGTPVFAAAPRTLEEVARTVGHRWPQVEPRDLGDALSTLVPLVQVPPRGLWRQSAPARNTTVEAWLGQPPAPPTPEARSGSCCATSRPTAPRRRPTSAPGRGSPGCRRSSSGSGRACAPSATSADARCSTSRARRCPTPTSRSPCATCLRSTTRCSGTTTAQGSSMPPTAGCPYRVLGCCSSTAGSPARGRAAARAPI